MPRRVRLSDHQRSAMISRWIAGERCSVIAKDYGVSPDYVRSAASRAKQHRGMSGHQMFRVNLREPIKAALYDEAEHRGMVPSELVQKVIEILFVDGLIAVILDDAP